jgi:hypothetical protein
MAKKRKLSEEQKEALRQRLEKARAAKGEPEYKSIHPSILELDEDHPLSMKNCKQYIKTQKILMAKFKSEIRSDVKGAKAKYYQCEGYIRNIQSYLKTGTWVDLFYGEFQEHKMGWKTVKAAG